MERATTIREKYEDTKQIKLLQSGCQIYHRFIISSNDIYFAFASTMTINIYDLNTLQLKSILNPNVEKMIKSIALNQGNKKELAVYYEQDVLIFNVPEEKIIERFKCNEPRQIEFNRDNKLLILSKTGELQYLDLYKKKVENIKISGKALIARWYPFDSAELAYANNDKKVISLSLNSKNKPTIINLDIKDDVYVSELCWYNLDESYKYVLIGLSDGTMQLNEFIEGLLLMKFEKFGTGIGSICWLKYEPGSFISSSKNSAKIAKWNVSNKNYTSVFKFSELSVLNMESIPNSPNKILSSNEDGSIIIYDLKANKIAFKQEPSHSESIFDLKYCKTNYGVFATCSYDGSIKIWDMNKNKILNVLRIDSTISFMKSASNISNMTNQYEIKIFLLCIKWSPKDKNLLLSGDNNGFIRLWDVSKEKLLDSVKFSSNLTNKDLKDIQIIGIDWDNEDNIIAAGNENIKLFKLENNRLVNQNSFEAVPPTVLCQVKFNPFDNQSFIAGGLDGTIRMFESKTKKNISELKGHQKKVFGISFNPERQGIFASSSDDHKIGIWDLNKNNKSSFLTGHTNNVRQLVWLTDFGNILISGSWDGCIKFWNIDLLVCVYTIAEHYSDVYGLDMCSDHPFLLMSSSRDNSIRFWNIPIFADKLVDYVINFKNPPAIKEYKDLNTKLSSVKDDDYISKADIISNFFFYSDGLSDLFDILKVVTKQKEFCSENNKIFYLTDLYSAYKSKINNNEFLYFSKNKFEYTKKREDLLTEAIELCSKIGDWEKYCELNIELNNWKEAIMAAPHVGLDYWKKITEKYAEYNKKMNFQENKFSALLCGNVQPALDLFIDANDFEDAKVIWLTRGEGNLNKKSKVSNESNSSSADDTLDYYNSLENRLRYLSSEDNLNTITYFISKKYILSGDPFLAAANFLSVKDTFNTLKTLIRSNEIEIAYMFMKLINDKIFEEDVYFALCMREYKKGNLETVFHILKTCESKEIRYIMCNLIGNLNTNFSSAIDIGEYLKKVNLTKTELSEHFSQTSNSFLVDLLSNNFNECQNIFYSTFDALEKNLLDFKHNTNWQMDFSLIDKMMKMLYYLKGTKITSFEGNKKFQVKIYLISAFLDVLNRNLRSAENILFDLNRFMKMNLITEEPEKTVLGFILFVLKNEINKNEEAASEILVRIYKDFISNWSNYVKILDAFKLSDNLYVLKYYTNDLPYFYVLREEIFPTNINNRPISSLNSKTIKGKCLKLSNNTLISCTQGLEWCKYMTLYPLIEETKLFYPF